MIQIGRAPLEGSQCYLLTCMHLPIFHTDHKATHTCATDQKTLIRFCQAQVKPPL